MSAKPKHLKQGEYHELRAQAHAIWPAAFPARGEPCKPLAIGAGARVCEDARFEASNRTKKAFLKIWTARPEYLDAILAGGPRYDLEGNPQSEVTEEEKAHTKKLIAAIEKRANAPRKDGEPQEAKP